MPVVNKGHAVQSRVERVAVARQILPRHKVQLSRLHRHGLSGPQRPTERQGVYVQQDSLSGSSPRPTHIQLYRNWSGLDLCWKRFQDTSSEAHSGWIKKRSFLALLQRGVPSCGGAPLADRKKTSL